MPTRELDELKHNTSEVHAHVEKAARRRRCGAANNRAIPAYRYGRGAGRSGFGISRERVAVHTLRPACQLGDLTQELFGVTGPQLAPLLMFQGRLGACHYRKPRPNAITVCQNS